MNKVSNQPVGVKTDAVHSIGPLDYHEEKAQAKRDAAEFEVMLRYLPAPTKADRRLASYGIDHESLGRLSRVTLKPGEAMEARLLPFSPCPERYVLRLFQHVWPPFDSPVKLRTVCAQKSDYTLVNNAADKCEACAAGVETDFHAIAYALVDDKRRAVGIKFTPQNLQALKSLMEQGVFDFQTGRRVRLTASDRYHLDYELLEREPVSEDDFRRAIIIGQPHLIPLDARLDKLHDMAAALDGWLIAGKPEPQPGQSERLIKLLPHCTLVPIPWGCKGPQEPGWQNVGYAMMKDDDYREKLDGGNIGLLCGRDQEAVNKKLVADQIIIGLDADSEDFANSVIQYNPWLSKTFAVEGGRGLKWFFAVKGASMEVCLQSTKIMQRQAEGDVEVGDWLASGKQGVVWGLHPSGKMYTPNGKPLMVIELKQFRLPKSCYLASQQVSIPTARECYRKHHYPRAEGPILDTSRLQDVTRRGDCIECACPACRDIGKDTAGNNLLIWPDGRYKCAAYISRSASENHEHNQHIYRLAGISRSNDYE